MEEVCFLKRSCKILRAFLLYLHFLLTMSSASFYFF